MHCCRICFLLSLQFDRKISGLTVHQYTERGAHAAEVGGSYRLGPRRQAADPLTDLVLSCGTYCGGQGHRKFSPVVKMGGYIVSL